MRTHSFLLALTFLVSIPNISKSFAAEPDERLHKQCLYPVVLVKGSDGGGTGFIVRSSHVRDSLYYNVAITCAHVVKGGSDFTVNVANYENWSSFIDYTSYQGVVYHMNLKMDIAVILFISEEKMPTVEMSFGEKLYIGNEVFRVGCGLLDEPRLDYGKITSLRTNVNDWIKNVARTSIHTIFGDSGAPVFHNYRVVGMTQAIRIMAKGFPLPGISYFIPIDRLKTWDDQENNNLAFIYKNKKLPALPFHELRLKSMLVTEK